MNERCHVDGNGDALDRGAFGWLCSSCWTRARALLARLLGRDPRR